MIYLSAIPLRGFPNFPALFTIGTNTYAANSAGEFIVSSQIFAPGGKFTNADTMFSIARDGRALIINGTSTQRLDLSYAIGTQVFSAGGSAVTVSGTVISMAPNGESVIIGESTTEDISALLVVQVATSLGPNPSLSGDSGVGGSEDVRSNSAPGKVRGRHWIRWQILVVILVGVGAFG
jgi:hypothetical protein